MIHWKQFGLGRWHWRLGRAYGFPLCCIVSFIVRIPFFDGAKSRGVCYVRSGDSFFVPCGVFHHAHRSLQDHWTANEIGMED